MANSLPHIVDIISVYSCRLYPPIGTVNVDEQQIVIIGYCFYKIHSILEK